MDNTIHPQTAIGHVHLIISNLERSLRFYTEIIGFRILRKNQYEAVLTADGATPLVVLEEKTDAVPKPPRTTGLYHFAILVPDRKSLAQSLFHLLQTGYPLQGASDHLFSEAVYLADPDGNGIEIYADRPREKWEKTENGEYKGVTEPLNVSDLFAQPGIEAWSGLPPKTRIGHIHLHVGDIAKAYDFYVRALGFEATIRMGTHALFVSAGGYHHHIGLNTWAGVGAPPPPTNAVGLRVFSILLLDEEELEKVAERLQHIGASVRRNENSIWTSDPFGNEIELAIQQ
ncbi:VOC family protein [Parageobacillus thermoglucosidasius]|uniref:VOC family protein n=1 Tax=Parageobacillus thermoglucosidasius TaxID=1426 RepID=UPI0001D1732E|nr:VOC family protein [Parageobacillus thermoglucosidasius]AEH49101.1 Glyoxalase/bleomycin resistance protein/dioxygenase [Parageobacillus thermoglucosidasius C56-YS93]